MHHRRCSPVFPRLFVCLLALIFSPCKAEAEESNSLVKFKEVYSMAFDRVIDIQVSDTGKLNRSISSEKMEAQVFEKQLSKSELKQLKRLLEKTNWENAANDEVSGLDGTTVSLDYQGKVYTTWSPNSSSKKRGLRGYQKVVEWLCEQGDLRIDKHGLAQLK